MAVGHYITEDKRRRIWLMAKSGYRPVQIARRLGITPETAWRWAERGGDVETRPKPTPERPPAQTPEEIEDRVVELRLEGWRTGEIAAEVGIDPHTVPAICKRRGVWLVRG